MARRLQLINLGSLAIFLLSSILRILVGRAHATLTGSTMSFLNIPYALIRFRMNS